MIFLFNVAGYYIVYLGWRFQARNEMAQRLDDENYSASETITIKLPYNLPYQDEGGGYKRVHGDFQHQGEFYKLVKQKIENDTLYVVCIKDNKEKKIFNFMADIVKSSTDMPATSSTMKLLNSLIKDYISSDSIAPVPSQQGWSAAFVFAQYHYQLSSEHTAYFSPPPDLQS
ncbi:MAG TPA: hypothetical protein VL443_14400 [Cyclobacteriaceae bacterium]|nr:hypothetical protein [Cyclobacteriaceae bacterium]